MAQILQCDMTGCKATKDVRRYYVYTGTQSDPITGRSEDKQKAVDLCLECVHKLAARAIQDAIQERFGEGYKP